MSKGTIPETYASSIWNAAFIGECMIELQRNADGTVSQSFGGDTFNTAAYAARIGRSFGVRAEYVSALGDDTFSNGMRAFWHAQGVGSALTASLPDKRPGLYFIELDAGGERSFVYWRGEAAARETFQGPGGEKLLERLAGFDCLYLSGITLAVLRDPGREKLLARLGELRAQGCRIAFDCNFRPRLWARDGKGTTPAMEARLLYEQTARHADILFISRDETACFGLAPGASPETVCATITSLGAREVVLKDGSGPAHAAYDGLCLAVPAEKAKQVTDTTAAGDSFAAAYLVARSLGLPPEESVRRAHQLALAVIGHRGAIISERDTPDIFADVKAR